MIIKYIKHFHLNFQGKYHDTYCVWGIQLLLPWCVICHTAVICDAICNILFFFCVCVWIKEVKKEEPKSKEEPKEAKEVKETPIQRRASGNVASLVQRISTYGIRQEE